MGIRLAVGQRTLEATPRHETLINLLNRFLSSRRQGLSGKTLKFYEGYLTQAALVLGLDVTGQDISNFLNSLHCNNGGKHAYFRALRAFYKWLYSPRSGYGLNPQDNPILSVDAPKVERRILPSVTEEQIDTLLRQSDNLRDRCIISLLADSGIRHSELTSIHAADFDWHNCTVTIWGKRNRQRKAPFTNNTGCMLRQYLAHNHNGNGGIWGLNKYGVQKVLKRLSLTTGIKCNPHAFRRGFACNLHRKRLSTLDIMRLGGWQDLSMVLRYTQSITFEDCLKHYKEVE